MRKFTINEKRAGEMAIRELSNPAQSAYNSTYPLTVWEYQTDGGKRYAYNFAGEVSENLSKNELESFLLGLWREANQ